MSEILENSRRRSAIFTAARLSVAGTLAATVTGAHAAGDCKEAASIAPTATAEQAIDTLEDTFGKHPGQRRNHVKGIGAMGTFVGNPSIAAPYSRSLLFSGAPIPVVARFSIAGGNPVVEDKDRSTRGMALEFRLPDGSMHHITMLNTPMFFANMPKTFIDKFAAAKPDRATGKPSPEKIRAFNASHPDATAQTLFLTNNNPPVSYANSAFFGIHTFKFVNREGKVTLARWRFVPRDGERNVSDEDMQSGPNEFLYSRISERVKKGAIQWDMIVSIGEPGDSETDPTIIWPANRREINVGTLILTSVSPPETAASNRINFDPLVMADGILPTNDPILLFRSPSYAYSYSRRQSEG